MKPVAALVLLLLATGCGTEKDRVHRPELCVFRAGAGVDPAEAAKTSCPSRKQSFADGETFYVLHTLPDKADVQDPVSISIETPCAGSAVTTTHLHDDRTVLFAAVAPVGAECSLAVTASILNETARFVSEPASDNCEAKCPTMCAAGAASTP
jgi:hypothetical protein